MTSNEEMPADKPPVVSALTVSLLTPRSNVFHDNWENGVICSFLPNINTRGLEITRFVCTEPTQNISAFLGNKYDYVEDVKEVIESFVNTSKLQLVIFGVEIIPNNERNGRAPSPSDLWNACDDSVHPFIRACPLTREILCNAHQISGGDGRDCNYNDTLDGLAASFLNHLEKNVFPRGIHDYEERMIDIAESFIHISHLSFYDKIWGADQIRYHIDQYRDATTVEEKLPHIKFIIRFDHENAALCWGVGIAASDGLHRCTGVSQFLCGQYPQSGQNGLHMQEKYDQALLDPANPAILVANLKCLDVIDEATLKAQRDLSKKTQKNQDKASPVTLMDFIRNLLRQCGFGSTLKQRAEGMDDVAQSLKDEARTVMEKTIEECKDLSDCYMDALPPDWLEDLKGPPDKIIKELSRDGPLPFPLNIKRSDGTETAGIPEKYQEFFSPGSKLGMKYSKNVKKLTAVIILLSYISTIDEDSHRTVMDLVTPSAWVRREREVKEPTSKEDAADLFALVLRLFTDAQYLTANVARCSITDFTHEHTSLELCTTNFKSIASWLKSHSSMNPVLTEKEDKLMKALPFHVKLLPVKFFMMLLFRSISCGPFKFTAAKRKTVLTQESCDYLAGLFTATSAESEEQKLETLVRICQINVASFEQFLFSSPDVAKQIILKLQTSGLRWFPPEEEVPSTSGSIGSEDVGMEVVGQEAHSIGTWNESRLEKTAESVSVAAAESAAAGSLMSLARSVASGSAAGSLLSRSVPRGDSGSAAGSFHSLVTKLTVPGNYEDIMEEIDGQLADDNNDVIQQFIQAACSAAPPRTNQEEAQLRYEVAQRFAVTNGEKKISGKRKTKGSQPREPTGDAPAAKKAKTPKKAKATKKAKAPKEAKKGNGSTALITSKQEEEKKILNFEALELMNQYNHRREQFRKVLDLMGRILPKKLPKSQPDRIVITQCKDSLRRALTLAQQVEDKCTYCITSGCTDVCHDNTLYCRNHLNYPAGEFYYGWGAELGNKETSTIAPCSFMLRNQCRSKPEMITHVCESCFSSYAHLECCRAEDGFNGPRCLSCYEATNRCDCVCDQCQTRPFNQTCIICNKGVHVSLCCSIFIHNLINDDADDACQKRFMDFLDGNEYARRLYAYKQLKGSAGVICLGCKEKYLSMS